MRKEHVVVLIALPIISGFVLLMDRLTPNSISNVRELEQRVARLEERMDKYGQQ